MFTLSPLMQNLPRHRLHVSIEGVRFRLECREAVLGHGETEVFEGDCHLNSAAAMQIVSPIGATTFEIASLAYRLDFQRLRVITVVVNLRRPSAIRAFNVPPQIREKPHLLGFGDGRDSAVPAQEERWASCDHAACDESSSSMEIPVMRESFCKFSAVGEL